MGTASLLICLLLTVAFDQSTDFSAADGLTAPEDYSNTADLSAVAEALRGMLVRQLPVPAVSTKHNWGQQREVITGYDLKRRGLLDWDGRPRKELKNDGHWTHLTVNIEDPEQNLFVELSNLHHPQPGQLSFSAAIRSPRVRLNVKQQIWNRGVRVLSNETRASCQAALHLDCHVTHRVEVPPGQSLPELIFTFKADKAEIFYKNLTIEHTLGLDGDAARVIGEATHKLLNRIKPAVERDLLAKANAAIVKAINGKEYRLALSALLK